MPRLLLALSAGLVLLLAPSVSVASSGDSATGNTDYGDSHIDFTATSNADGSSPTGNVTDLHFNGLAYHGTAADVWGHVTCLNVSGNEAAIGFVVDRAYPAGTHDKNRLSAAVGQALVLYVQDGGSDDVPDWFSNSGWVPASQASTGGSACHAQALGPGNAGYYPGSSFHVTDTP